MMKQYFIVLATCLLGIQAYGQQYGSFKDARDGRVYKTVKIGEQVWMAENLNVDRFRNGDLIPEARTVEEWKAAGENRRPAWCFYNNDQINGAKKGKLYNWYAVNDYRGLSPIGYHIPSETEWDTLGKFLEGWTRAGLAMKTKSGWGNYTTAYGSRRCANCATWNAEYRGKVPCHVCKDTRLISDPETINSGNGNNNSGFSAGPYGFRYYGGSFDGMGKVGKWWCAEESDSGEGFNRNLNYDNNGLSRNLNYKEGGLSVRCIKD